MRILIVNRMLLMSRGGGETFDLEMGRALLGRDHRVEYLTAQPLLGPPAIRSHQKVKLHAIRSPYWGWVPWDQLPGAWRVRVFDFRTFQHRAIQWVLKHEGNYDIIQVCELPEFVKEYKRRGGLKPVVARLTAPDYYDPCNGFRQADAVIASGATMEAVRSRGLSVQDIPNGVDTQVFSPGSSAFCKRWPNDASVAVCVARFQSVKGHEILLRAFKDVIRQDSRWFLVLAGSGPEMARMQRLCRTLGITGNVEFLGETPHENLPDIYRAADVVVIPSLYESFCFAALEGMACGKPIISSGTPWIPKLLGAEEFNESDNQELPGGWVVPVSDSEALARAMLHLQKDPQRRAAMGKRNHEEVVENYGWSESARKLGELYTEIVRKDEGGNRKRRVRAET